MKFSNDNPFKPDPFKKDEVMILSILGILIYAFHIVSKAKVKKSFTPPLCVFQFSFIPDLNLNCKMRTAAFCHPASQG
jgi:hypothetical protein